MGRRQLYLTNVLFSHAFSGELKAMSIMNEAVQERVPQGGVTYDVVPMFHGDLAVTRVEARPWRSSRSSRRSRRSRRIDISTRFLEDGRICLSNNAAEREPRGIALGRKSAVVFQPGPSAVITRNFASGN